MCGFLRRRLEADAVPHRRRHLSLDPSQFGARRASQRDPPNVDVD